MKRRSFLASALLALICPWKTVAKTGTVAIKTGVYIVEKDVSFYPYIYAPYIPFYRTPTLVLDDFIARKPKVAPPPLMSRRKSLHEFAQGQQSAAKRQTRWNGRKVNSKFYRSGMVGYPAGEFLRPKKALLPT
jgi:hypothetical protein